MTATWNSTDVEMALGNWARWGERMGADAHSIGEAAREALVAYKEGRLDPDSIRMQCLSWAEWKQARVAEGVAVPW